MHIEKVRLSNFWCFGEDPVSMKLSSGFTVFIGANGSGKTAVMNGLLRLFGQSNEHRRIRKSDFHCIKGQDQLSTEQSLFIETVLAFPELEEGNDKTAPAVPEFFNQMTIEENGVPKCRFRLEATWTDDGTTEGAIEQDYFVITSLDEEFLDSDRNRLSATDRSKIRMTYVPAVRSSSSQMISLLKSSLWKAIAWSEDLKDAHSTAREQLDTAYQAESSLKKITSKLNQRWGEVHKAGTDANISFSPMDSDFESFSARAETRFSPTEAGGERSIHELSDGQRSLFHISLNSAVLDLEMEILSKKASGFNRDTLHIPQLTILAIEEPENNLAPFYLSRILRQVQDIVGNSHVQAVISSHSASTLARVEPKHIRFFRKDSDGTVKIRRITLPKKASEAGKYVREAVKAYPELYFAKFVVLGEGDSELILLPRLAEALDLHIDPSFVAIVPLGGRHVNHFWRLLNNLKIPHATLLDLDLGRGNGGWGRIKYACEQLHRVKRISNEKYEESQELDDEGGDFSDDLLPSWIRWLKGKRVFFSSPLDIDLLMLEAMSDKYKELEDGDRGPTGKAGTAKEAVLKDDGDPSLYDASYDEYFRWYRYLFLGRGKPASHLKAMGLSTTEDLSESIPDVLKDLIECIRAHIDSDDY